MRIIILSSGAKLICGITVPSEPKGKEVKGILADQLNLSQSGGR